MSAEMLVAVAGLIGAVGAIVSAILMYRKTVNLLEYRMGNVEKKLDTHNGYAEKMSEIQLDIAVIKNDIKHIVEEERE